MQVKELIEELLRAPPDAIPVVNGVVINGVALRRGTIRSSSPSVPRFSKDPNGEVHGLVFLVSTEMANGVVKSRPR